MSTAVAAAAVATVPAIAVSGAASPAAGAPDPDVGVTAAAPPPDWSRVQIRNVANNGALLPRSGSRAAGSDIAMIAGWKVRKAQQWKVIRWITPIYGVQFENLNATGMCLEAKENLGSSASDIGLRACERSDPGRRQLWSLRVSSKQSSHYHILSLEHGTRALKPNTPASHNSGVLLVEPENTNTYAWTIDSVY
ncbi:hypothetical protein D0T12_31825 [Actinomadura spongiicola]|uniref:Uncharacterized protein n=1 Tax=Actinomadura spongiicola TaxID=2303421 RepID=A0A372G8Y9_9ACTN|nr:hypothetical protein D0T12_31825 [Actinomadura spongiicola]